MISWTRSSTDDSVGPRSWLHRLPAHWKIVGLIAVLILVTAVRRWIVPLLCLFVGAMVLLASTRTSLRKRWHILWPTLPFIVCIGIYHYWTGSPSTMLRTCVFLLTAVLYGCAVTVTTDISDVIDGYSTLLRPLSRWGVPTERIALALTLTLTLIPAFWTMIVEVREARQARGATRSLRALMTPLLVRVIRTADGLSEGLIARGIDDAVNSEAS